MSSGLRFGLLAAGAVLLASLCAAQAPALDVARFASPDGALVLAAGGNDVEPYFATKALLVAADAGLDTRKPASSWIGWLLPKQRRDGRFDRYCRSGEGWKKCGAADADDSMLALWLELIYRAAPDSGLPAEWQSSAKAAQKYLASLRNARLGVYYVSRKNHSALFMDNVEVYGALREVARAQTRFGQTAAAAATDAEADKLASAIRKIFWSREAQRFMPSMEKTRPAFYPDVLAQVYPLLSNLPTGEADVQQSWSKWKASFARPWLENRYDPHAWGLVAVAALKAGDPRTAACWRDRAAENRFGHAWNILEEAAFQAVSANTASQPAGSNCENLVTGQ